MGFVFMLERYCSADNFPLWISELMSASGTDLYIVRALVVSLVHKHPSSYVITSLANLSINASEKSTFRPPGDWKASTFRSSDACQKIAPFRWEDVFFSVLGTF